MRLFDRLSLRNKLMAIILIFTTTALLGGITCVIVDGVATFKTEMVERSCCGPKSPAISWSLIRFSEMDDQECF